MEKMDEETALAILFANTKRKKRNVDLITIAKTCEYLTNLYNSQKKVADKVGLSSEMIREFRSALKLPEEVQKLILSRKIDRIDIIKELSSLKNKIKQIALAKNIANLKTKDVRDVKRMIKQANVSIEESKRKVSDSKLKGLHIFLVDFTDETYNTIVNEAKKRQMKPAELVRQIITNWTKRRNVN
jgi:ParB-like chromosome segregation protein Spo0J